MLFGVVGEDMKNWTLPQAYTAMCNFMSGLISCSEGVRANLITLQIPQILTLVLRTFQDDAKAVTAASLNHHCTTPKT